MSSGSYYSKPKLAPFVISRREPNQICLKITSVPGRGTVECGAPSYGRNHCRKCADALLTHEPHPRNHHIGTDQ